MAIALLAGSYLVLNQTIYLDLGLFQLQLASQLMAIEDLLTLYAMLAGVSDPIRKLANVHSKIQRAAAAADRICALMDREPQVVERPGAIEPAAAPPGDRVRGRRFQLRRTAGAVSTGSRSRSATARPSPWSAPTAAARRP